MGNKRVLTPQDEQGFNALMGRIDRYSENVLTFPKTADDLDHAVSGLNEQVGALFKEYKQAKHYGAPLDPTSVLKKCGDILWYVALGTRALDFKLSGVYVLAPSVGIAWHLKDNLIERARGAIYTLAANVGEISSYMTWDVGVRLLRLTLEDRTDEIGADPTEEERIELDEIEGDYKRDATQFEHDKIGAAQRLSSVLHLVTILSDMAGSSLDDVLDASEARFGGVAVQQAAPISTPEPTTAVASRVLN